MELPKPTDSPEQGKTESAHSPKTAPDPLFSIQAAIWLSWPHNVETWPENLALAQAEFLKLVETIATTQRVCLIAAGDAKTSAETQLQSISNPARSNVSLIDIPTNDAWARDYAPTFVRKRNGDLIAIDWNYNAWGEKYPPFDDDQKVARRIAEHLGIAVHTADICFEGGAIEVNDSGLLLTTRSCALDPRRNPEKSLDQIETALRECLGNQHTIWLAGNALEGDDTDGHIDQLARFTDDNTIVYAWTDHPNDPQLQPLERNRLDLQSQLAETGLRPIRLIPLPIPAPIEFHQRRIPASYCNFLITNDLVIVPQFGRPEDDQAIRILKPLFPRRNVIGLPSLNLSVGLGSFHCLSQQQGHLSAE